MWLTNFQPFLGPLLGPEKSRRSQMVQPLGAWKMAHWYLHESGQIIIFHQPRFHWNKGISLTKPQFKVTSAEVAIIWPDEWLKFMAWIGKYSKLQLYIYGSVYPSIFRGYRWFPPWRVDKDHFIIWLCGKCFNKHKRLRNSSLSQVMIFCRK